MDSKSKRRKGAADRISQLPHDVCVHILSYLPMLCSVRTTVLSKRWNNLWTFLPTLDLVYAIPYDSQRPKSDYDKFADFVDHALSSHSSSNIRKLRLHIEGNIELKEEEFSRVQTWISTVMRHEVSELDISFYPLQYIGKVLDLKLPASVVRCKTLEVLKVSSYCIAYPPTDTGCFSRLKFADITGFIARDIEDSSLNTLFCHCPELQTLRATISADSETKVPRITIDAPKLQNIVVYGECFGQFPIYNFQNVKSLVKANIENDYIEENNSSPEVLNRANRATALLAGVSSAEYLHIAGPNFVECSLPSFSNLKQLKLVLFGCSDLEYLMELLKRSPKLEDLALDFDVASWYDDKYVEYKPFVLPETVPICVVSQLKTVSITHITGHNDQLDVVKYLLKYGQVLRNMTIVLFYSSI